jgi:predicted kinase
LEELLLKGISVILDATNLTESNRKPLYRIAERTNAKIILVRVEAPAAVVKKRLQSRSALPGSSKSDADWAIYRKMMASDEIIKRPHYTVNTSRNMTPVIEKIVGEASR